MYIKKNSRRALLLSVMSLILCCAMLVGTTFAWFTDEVKSGMNTIAAGNLDVELRANGIKVENGTKLFDDVTLWEPGVVVYEKLQVANVGSLALKYQMTLNFGKENDLNGHKLSEVLKVAVLKEDKVSDWNNRDLVLTAAKAAVEADQGDGTLSNFYQTGVLAPKGETMTVENIPVEDTSAEAAVVIYWEPGDNDNWYNANNGQTTSDGQPLHIEFGVHLQATQQVNEYDSFGNDYDKLSSILPKATVNNTGAQTVDATIGMGGAAQPINLDTSFQFLPNESAAEAAASEYAGWHADYVISADRAVPANSMVLAGYYSAFCDGYNGGNWVTIPVDTDVPANTKVALVEHLGATVNYEMICEFGNDGKGFKCGVADLTGENAGTTITVDLVMYETNPMPHEAHTDINGNACSGNTANCRTGVEKVIGRYTYTFGSTSVEGLQAALAAGNPRIELDADLNLVDEPLTITQNTTIDLNGHTITGQSTSNTTSNLIKVQAGAQLTLTGNGTINFAATKPDTNWGGEGQPAFPGYANNTISCSGKLVIDGVTIKNSTAPGGASYAIDCYPGADLVIKSGTIDGCGKVAIRMFANSNTDATNVTINGGTITGRRGIWVQLPGNNIANVRPVNLTINGGKIISTDASDCAIYSYSYGDSFAKTNVTISGGEFFGDVCFGGGEKTTEENVTITGGTFNGELGRYLANDGWEDIAQP